MSGFKRNYLKCQATACQDYNSEGFNQPPGIFIPMLAEVFVPLELSSESARNTTDNVRPVPTSSKKLDGINITMTINYRDEPQELQIWNILAEVRTTEVYRRMAILAWGGYGKTTLMRHITYIYATSPSIAQAYKAPRLIPVLLYLRKWRDLLAGEDPPSLPRLIATKHIPELPGGRRLLPLSSEFRETPHVHRWADSLLRKGNALVMFDGFDEVAESQRQAVSEWINQQMWEYPQSIFILTSRPAGYQNYVSEKLSTTLFVKPFKPEQRQRFINQWYLTQERYARGGRNTPNVQEEAMLKAKGLIQQVEQRRELGEMAKNPLLLNMIATFHRFYPSNELPQRRTELYQEICKLQLGDRPLAKRINMLLPPRDSQRILQGVALEMVLQNLTIISRNSLLNLIEIHLATVDTTVNSVEFLEQIVKVSELLVEREPDEFEFAHLSFQSYLAATEVKSVSQENILLQHYAQAWWYETILLYAAQANPTSLIQSLCRIGTPASISLAYDCLQLSRKKVLPEVESELQLLETQLQVIRYRNLERYLREEEWQKADQETYRLMLKTMGKEEEQTLDKNDLAKFPCTELKRVDELWLRHSKGRFGFSVQKEIYQQCGGIADGNHPNDEVWNNFAISVGWSEGNSILFGYLTKGQVTFDISAPLGHLPSRIFFSNHSPLLVAGRIPAIWAYARLFRRLGSCGVR